MAYKGVPLAALPLALVPSASGTLCSYKQEAPKVYSANQVLPKINQTQDRGAAMFGYGANTLAVLHKPLAPNEPIHAEIYAKDVDGKYLKIEDIVANPVANGFTVSRNVFTPEYLDPSKNVDVAANQNQSFDNNKVPIIKSLDTLLNASRPERGPRKMPSGLQTGRVAKPVGNSGVNLLR